jgi:hypothetical protein
MATGGFCDSVTQATARQVAQNQIALHISLYGHWNHITSPTVGDAQVIYHEGDAVAYNFSIEPSGHIMVAVDDVFSPVLLYSTTSEIDADRLDSPGSIESWILPELGQHVRDVNQARAAASGSATRAMAVSEAGQRISAAWSFLTTDGSGSDSGSASRSLDGSSTERSATAEGPLLETAWGQGSPYNLQTPLNSCTDGAHTLTGCVATAWAQLMRYWRWPIQGQDNHSYEWNGQTLEANFGATTYYWNNMPNKLYSSSTADEKEAVSTLMYHAGVAAEMLYGCNSSGSYAYADEALDIYFGYKETMHRYDRGAYPYSSDWLDLIRAEMDADPPRPVVLTVWGTGGGHEVIIDGYQSNTSSTDMVHINYGWTGSYNGYYDITQDFENYPYFIWYANDQIIITGIEPENDPPQVTINDDQEVEEETSVQLSCSATDPDGVGIRSTLWSQTSGPTVTLSNAAATSPSFTAPNVHSPTQLMFSLRVDDINLAVTTKTCTITVRNTDGSTEDDPSDTMNSGDTPSRSSGGGSSGGGCFLKNIDFWTR